MIIKEINMLAFGKFHNARVPLSPGLNIIYGVNESGKSTIHRFIEGMFFGFYKPYSKNKVFTPEHSKYKPWSGQDYKGVVLYEQQGKAYRLERNFSKTRESVKLFDAVTNADLSELLEFDFTNKMPKANIHLPINNVLFKNTVSIGQLSNITDNDLVREIGDLFVDTSGTHSAGVSLKLAIDQLEALKEAIGEEDNFKTPLGKDAKRLEELNAEMAATRELYSTDMVRYAQVKKMEDRLAEMQADRGSMAEQRRRIRLGIMRGRYEKYVNLVAEQKGLEEIITAGDFDEALIQDYERAYARHEAAVSQLEAAEKAGSQARRTIERAEGKMGELSVKARSISYEEMNEDRAVLDAVNYKLESLQAEKAENENPELIRSYHNLNTSTSIANIVGIVASVAGMLLLFLSFLADNPIVQTIGLAVLSVGLLFFGAWFGLSRAKNKKQLEFERYDTIMNRTMNMILMCELDQEQFKAKYHTRSLDDLLDLLANAQEASARSQELDRQLAVSQEAFSSAQETIEKCTAEIDAANAELARCMKAAGADSPESFRYAIAMMREAAVNAVKLESVNAAIVEVLGEDTPKKLERAAKEAEEKDVPASLDATATVEEELEKNNAQIMALASQISTMKEEIINNEASVRSLCVIAEEIVATKSRIDRYKVDLAAYSMAIERINGLSHEIQSTFAQAFNDYVSAMISVITKGKYMKVYVNENMEIKVEDKQLGQLVNVSSLSGGTIDQLYFCVRFAIMDLIIKDKNIPVILDDCMLQYDDSRLNNILDLLYEKSKERQILLFTCRNAEKLALDEKGYPYNHIKLSDIGQPRPVGVTA